MCVRILAARYARVLRFVVPQEREQGMPDARCTRGLVCKTVQRKRTRAYRFSGGNPTFPAQWLYGLCRALPGDEFFLVTVTSGYGLFKPGWANAPPFAWHQQRMPGPHGFAVRRRPRQPSTRDVPQAEFSDEGAGAPFVHARLVRSRIGRPALRSLRATTLLRPPHPIPRS